MTRNKLSLFATGILVSTCASVAWMGYSHQAAAAANEQSNSARIELISQDTNTLTMRFVDALGMPKVQMFTWSEDEQSWTGTIEGNGVVFGNDQPQFATAVQQRRLGV